MLNEFFFKNLLFTNFKTKSHEFSNGLLCTSMFWIGYVDTADNADCSN